MTATDTAGIAIRPARESDAGAISELNVQLGYPASAIEVQGRVAEIANCPHQAVFVALVDGRVIGWVEVAVTRHVQSSPYALIGGLVVAEGQRGRGIGRMLCHAAEDWSRQQGINTVRVTSRSTRLDAHRFYLRDGYREVKKSLVFEKIL